MLKFLNKDKSVSKYLGPRSELRPMLPKVSTAGCAHGPSDWPAVKSCTVVGWYQYPVAFGSPERVPSLIEPTLSGRHGPVSLEAWHDFRLGVNGSPLEKFVVPFNSQPPMSKSAARPAFPANFFPLPKGSW